MIYSDVSPTSKCVSVCFWSLATFKVSNCDFIEFNAKLLAIFVASNNFNGVFLG